MGMCLVLKEWGGVASVGEDGTEEDFQDIELKKKRLSQKNHRVQNIEFKKKEKSGCY